MLPLHGNLHGNLHGTFGATNPCLWSPVPAYGCGWRRVPGRLRRGAGPRGVRAGAGAAGEVVALDIGVRSQRCRGSSRPSDGGGRSRGQASLPLEPRTCVRVRRRDVPGLDVARVLAGFEPELVPERWSRWASASGVNGAAGARDPRMAAVSGFSAASPVVKLYAWAFTSGACWGVLRRLQRRSPAAARVGSAAWDVALPEGRAGVRAGRHRGGRRSGSGQPVGFSLTLNPKPHRLAGALWPRVLLEPRRVYPLREACVPPHTS